MGKLLSGRYAGKQQLFAALNPRRTTVEANIQAEEAIFAKVIRLINDQVQFTDWSELCQRVLRAALTEEGEGMEAYKARLLRRHLFRGERCRWPALPSSTLSPEERRMAERLRADLAAQVRLGSGIKVSELNEQEQLPCATPGA